MRRRIKNAVSLAVTTVCLFLCVCCAASEDASDPGMAVKEEGEAVSENVVSAMPSEGETETTGTPEETGSGEMPETAEEPVEESEDKNLIYYVSDNRVWENDLFCAFLKGEATAYDRHQEENLTWPEYFRQYMEYRCGYLQGMQLAAEDLDGDGKEELMVMLDDRGESTDLYVFHEEGGKLYAWDKIENFYALQGGQVLLREGGIFDDVWTTRAYGFNHCTWRFNKDGEQEFIWCHSDCEEVEHFTGEDGTEYIRVKVSLYLYEDGECVRELSYILQNPEDEDWSEAELVEGTEEFEELEDIYSTLTAALPEKIDSFSLPKWSDNAVKIPIWEAPGGQGWVNVEDQFEYVGEEEGAAASED